MPQGAMRQRDIWPEIIPKQIFIQAFRNINCERKENYERMLTGSKYVDSKS